MAFSSKILPFFTLARLSSSSAATPKRVGIIGLGNVGSLMAKNLLAKAQAGNSAKYQLACLLDTNSTKLNSFPSSIHLAKDPKDLSERCDIVVTALPLPDDVKTVMEGDTGILQGLRPGMTWIDHSTTDYHQTLDFSTKSADKGASALEAPVTGGIALLRQGKMTCLVGGNSEVFQAHRSLIEQYCLNVLYMGAIGSATITKIVSNMLAGAHTVVMGEALMIAKRSGVDLRGFFDGIRLSAGNSYVFETEAPLVFNGTFDPDFAIKLHCKDFKLGQKIADQYDIPLPVMGLVDQIYNLTRLRYGGDAGSSHPPKLLEEAIGEEIRDHSFDDWTYSIEMVEGGSIGVVQKKKSDFNK